MKITTRTMPFMGDGRRVAPRAPSLSVAAQMRRHTEIAAQMAREEAEYEANTGNCRSCRGTGRDDSFGDDLTCPRCGGSGMAPGGTK